MGRPRKPLTEQRGNLTVITMQTKKSEEESVTVGKNQLKRQDHKRTGKGQSGGKSGPE